LSETSVMLSVVVFYLLGTFGLQKFMHDRQPVKGAWLTNIVFYHNCLLSLASFILLLFFLELIVPQFVNGLFFVV